MSATSDVLRAALDELKLRRAEIAALKTDRALPIAIVGAACRFPGESHTPDGFWDFLARSGDGVGEIPPDRWRIDDYYDSDPSAQGRMATRRAAFLTDVYDFDPQLFGMAPKEAAMTDPQQRLLLEVASEAIENANMSRETLRAHPTGIYVGITCFDHAIMISDARRPSSPYAGTGSALNMAAGRLSFALGLHGPSMAIDTACSSSLVCLHLAVESLRAGQTRTALAGGVNLILSPDVMVSFSQARMLAPDGRCKTFDAAADGYGRGEGCGVVVLKRLADAQAEGDRILGIIAGTAIDHGGAGTGLTVPSRVSQERVIAAALAQADVAPRDVSYVEAHGTGTSLGDPIEIEALSAAYGAARPKDAPLLVGSVKTNIGHLESAAGMAGLMKLLLAFDRETLPPHLHFNTPNPHTSWQDIPVRVVTRSTPWVRGAHSRLAGLSAFGFSGTNAHIVIAEPPVAAPCTHERRTLGIVSAHDAAAAGQLMGELAHLLSSVDAEEGGAIRRAAAFSRADASHRIAWLANGGGEPVIMTGQSRADAPVPLLWLNGEAPDADVQALQTEPAYGAAYSQALQGESGPARAFAAGFAWAELLRNLGLEPEVISGEGPGLLAAAVAAGILNLAVAKKIIAAWNDPVSFTAILVGLTPKRGKAVVVQPVTGVPVTGDDWRDPDLWTATVTDRQAWRAASVCEGGLVLPVPCTGPAFDLAIGRLWVAGLTPNWRAFFTGSGQPRAMLPNHPYRRERLRPPGIEGARARSDYPATTPEFYRIVWEARPVAAAVEIAARPWLIVGDSDAATMLEENLRSSGAMAGQITKTEACDGARLAACLGQRACRVVVFVEDDETEPYETALRFFIAFVRILDTIGAEARPEITVVTRDAVAVDPQAALTGLAQSAAWGFVRCAVVERPDLFVRLIDLDAQGKISDPDRLVADILSPSGDQLSAWRDETRFTARIDCVTPLRGRPIVARRDGVWLVTGGLGALGLRFASWLADQGVVHLLLAGRTPPTQSASAVITALQARGVTVETVACDVSSEHAVKALFATISAGDVPLRGIVHAAGVVDMRPLSEIDDARIAAMLGAKARGALYLHEASLGCDLDHFVLFSSIASVWGSRGQAHYAASNSVLDALAYRRRHLGLPAISLNWGPWSDGGMTDETAQAVLRQAGVRPLAPQSALACLSRLPDHPVLAVADIAWERFIAAYEARGRHGFFDRLRPEQPAIRAEPSVATTLPERGVLQKMVIGIVGTILGLDESRVERDRGLFDMGMNSLMAMELRGHLETMFGLHLPTTLLFDAPTVDALCGLLERQTGNMHDAATKNDADKMNSRPAAVPEDGSDAVAIIGYACRFPGGADTPEAFWSLLDSETDAIESVPVKRGWPVETGHSPILGGFLKGVDEFDAGLFRITPREAVAMDPQQRLLLETTYQAFEHAGLPPDRLKGSETGVFVGITTNDYAALQADADKGEAPDAFVFTGSPHNAAAGRLSYVFGLQGPSIAIDTACSSSLVAVHLASRSLRDGECGVAVAGGVNLILSPRTSTIVGRTGALSLEGRCKTFSAAADGFVRSEGCGVVILKRLSKAQADGDRVLGILRGSAVNQDGASVGFTAPNGRAQEAVIRRALGRLPADTIDYVEAHGTGTKLGDPVELMALEAVFAPGRDPARKLQVGAVKTNIGHAESAAGMAGLIKLLLALQHEKLPRSLHCDIPTPLVDWGNASIEVCTAHRLWLRGDRPRRAGVSAFGATGTNAHLIIEEPPTTTTSEPVDGPFPFVLAARTPEALRALAGRTAHWLRQNDQTSLTAICRTAARRPTAYAHVSVLLATSRDEILARCDALADGTMQGRVKGSMPNVGFLFTGQGSQYEGMVDDLRARHPVFRAAFDACVAIAGPALNAVLERNAAIHETANAQPAIFSMQYALCKLLESFGVRPQAVLGHSVGEFAAAWAAGAMPIEAALPLIIERGRLMQALPAGGRMAAVFADEASVRKAIASLGDGIDIAAINGDAQVVISGDEALVVRVCNAFEARGVGSVVLDTSHAFHSARLEPMLDALEAFAAQLPATAPRIAFCSNLSGQRIETAPDARYWRRHAREPVRFADGVRALQETGVRIVVEIGPKPVLTSLARGILNENGPAFVGTPVRPGQGGAPLAHVLLALHEAGVDIDWSAYFNASKQPLVDLPGHALQRASYWITRVSRHDETSHCKTGQPMPTITQDAAAARQGEILAWLRGKIGELTQVPAAAVNVSMPFLEMGADSIILIEAIRLVERQYGLRLTMRRFFEDLATVEALAGFIAEQATPPAVETALVSDRTVAPAAVPAEVVSAALPAAVEPSVPEVGASISLPVDATESIRTHLSIEHVLLEQTQAVTRMMAQQMDLLRALGPGRTATVPSPMRTTTPVQSQVPASATVSSPVVPAIRHVPARTAALPWGSPVERRAQGLSPVQQGHLEDLIARYTKRTQRSKEAVAASRAVLADSRATVGFRFSTKEMLYPIVGKRAEGAHLWDVDGNEYIDFTMGFGVHLFGHAPDFVQDKVSGEWSRHLELGARSTYVADVAERFCRLTGHERVAFANTGTEAVMAAMRLSRAVTGREKIVIFSHSYHGHADGTLVAADPSGEIAAIAPGVPHGSIENILVLDYGTDEAIAAITAHASELAAVMVEPVQSRNPSLQPETFLRRLREVTERLDIALIFDEMITGFRAGSRGAQGHFGVQADLATYGKIIGGGLPLGAIGGTARYMDSIDGGMWSYGDHSFPEAERTAFGGTFCQYPLAMSAALAVLEHIENDGGALYEALNERTAILAKTLNAFFAEMQAPIKVTYFASMFRFEFSANLDLFFYHMLEKGIYIWEWRTCFLSTAHSQVDIDRFIDAVKESVVELRTGGYITQPVSSGPARKEGNAAATVATFPGALSEAQRQLWLLAQVDPTGSVAYNVNTTLDLSGPLNLAAMRGALETLVQRHEALRTVISADGTRRIVKHTMTIDVPLIETDHEDWLRLERSEPFDLTQGPLFRAAVLRQAPDHHLLSLSVHHIISDGFSCGLLLEDLARLYNGAQPDDIPLTFDAYLEALAVRTHDGRDAADRAFWATRLAGGLPALELPLDRPRPTRRAFHGARVSTSLAVDLTNSLRDLARRNGATLFATLFSGFAAFLHRVTGQDRILIGTPVTGRSVEGSDRMVGYCTHLVPVLSERGPDMRVREFLSKTRSELFDMLDHQDYPFGRLLRDLALSQDLTAASVIAAVFNLEPVSSLPAFDGLSVVLVEDKPQHTAFELNVNVIDNGGDLLLAFDYDTELFDAVTAQRWLSGFCCLLEAMTGDADRPVHALPLISAEAEAAVLRAGRGPVLPIDEAGDIHAAFARQAAFTPDRTALVTAGEDLSYAALAARVGQIASGLVEAGVRKGDVVAIYGRRDKDLVAGLLAVLRLGATYVPLDPAWPAARVLFMLEDAGASVVLGHSDLVGQIATCAVRAVSFADMGNVQDAPPALVAIAGEDPAYILYTSGSTGQPKGVVVPQRAVLAFVSWMRHAFTEAQLSGVFAATSICFDLSVFEILGNICVGGTTILADDALVLSTHPARDRVTLLNLVPSVCATLLDAGAIPDGVTVVNLAGEALHGALVERLRALRPGVVINNLYGPTEDTTYSTGHTVDRIDSGGCPIGRSLPNAFAVLLDADLMVVPAGVTGEICLGGDGLALGYHARPDMTASRFIDRPTLGGRLYRTGDLGRFDDSGILHFLGRTDHQVKLRGFRIELGEIEASLLAQDGVQAAVVAVLGQGATARLVAWLSSDIQAEAILPGIQARLAKELPAYMQPLTYHVLSAMQRLPNGKIDRKHLITTEASEGAVASVSAQAGPTDRPVVADGLRAIWREVLNRADIGATANFFEMGGNSLSAVQLAARVTRDLGIDCDIRTVFLNPTLANLSEALDQRKPTELPPMQRIADAEHDALSPPQRAVWSRAMLFGAEAPSPTPVVFEINGPLDTGILRRAAMLLGARHEILRTRIRLVEGEPRAFVLDEADAVSFRVVDAASSPDGAVARLEAEEGGRRLDPEHDVLLRLTLVRLGETEHACICVLHHLASDGWSIEILLDDLATLYESLVAGRVPDEPKGVRYRDYATWLNEVLRGREGERLKSYWQRMLRDAPPAQILRGDRVPVTGGAPSWRVLRRRIDISRLTRMATLYQATPFIALLAVVQALLFRRSGKGDFVVGTPVAARVLPEFEPIVGPFLNVLPLRGKVERDEGFNVLLERARVTTIEAFAHQLYPVLSNFSGREIFSVGLTLHNQRRPAARSFGEARVTLRADLTEVLSTNETNAPLWFLADPQDGMLFIEIVHDDHRFSSDYVERLADDLAAIIVQVSANPRVTIGKLILGNDRRDPNDDGHADSRRRTLDSGVF